MAGMVRLHTGEGGYKGYDVDSWGVPLTKELVLDRQEVPGATFFPDGWFTVELGPNFQLRPLWCVCVCVCVCLCLSLSLSLCVCVCVCAVCSRTDRPGVPRTKNTHACTRTDTDTHSLNPGTRCGTGGGQWLRASPAGFWRVLRVWMAPGTLSTSEGRLLTEPLWLNTSVPCLMMPPGRWWGRSLSYPPPPPHSDFHMCVCERTRVYVYIHIHVCGVHTCTGMYLRTHANTHTHTHARMHA